MKTYWNSGYEFPHQDETEALTDEWMKDPKNHRKVLLEMIRSEIRKKAGTYLYEQLKKEREKPAPFEIKEKTLCLCEKIKNLIKGERTK